MTDPIVIPGVSTQGWGGHVAPPETRNYILNLLVGGAPFGNSLTRDPTNRPSVAYPTAQPSGFAWLGELQEFPNIDLGDNVVVVAVKKLGGVIDLSNELVSDSAFNITTALQTLLTDGLSRDLDLGLLFGSGEDNEPAGVVPNAPGLTGPTEPNGTLLQSVSSAIGDINDAGGTADTIAMSGGLHAWANALTAEGSGQLMFPGGFAAAVGLTPVVVPGLETVLVYDSSRCFLVLNGNESEVAISSDYRFNFDATSIRIKTRATVAIPDPNKSIRKLEPSDGNGTRPQGGTGQEGPAKAS